MLHLTNDTHRYSPLGDSRERPVPCGTCATPTGNICGHCNTHCGHEAEAAIGAVAAQLNEHEDRAVPAIMRVDPAQGRDVKATVGMARLLLDMARVHPASPTVWQMLASTLKALEAKTGTVCDSARQQTA